MFGIHRVSPRMTAGLRESEQICNKYFQDCQDLNINLIRDIKLYLRPGDPGHVNTLKHFFHFCGILNKNCSNFASYTKTEKWTRCSNAPKIIHTCQFAETQSNFLDLFKSHTPTSSLQSHILPLFPPLKTDMPPPYCTSKNIPSCFR